MAGLEPETHIQADNRPLPRQHVRDAYIVLAVILAILMTGVYGMTNWQLWTILVFYGVLYLSAIPFLLLISKGDWLAWRGIAAHHRTERQRIEATEAVAVENIDAGREARRLQHLETMQELEVRLNEIERQAADHDLFLRRLVRVEERLRLAAVPEMRGEGANFIPARADEDRLRERTAVVLYLRRLYRGPEGRPHHEEVQSDGRILKQAPWSKRGAWPESMKRRGLEILTEPQPSAEPIITPDTERRGYYLNIRAYPDLGAIHRILQ